MPNRTIISLDIGATKCAAAIVSHDQTNEVLSCQNQFRLKLRDCNSFAELIEAMEKGLNTKFIDADAVCIGAAGQYDGRQLQLEKGYPYPMNIAEIAKQQNWPDFAVVHDYTPIVCATFTSYMDDPNNIQVLNKGKMNKFGRRVALGIGTGLGVKDGILFPNGDFWLGTNEMGHIGITQPPLADKSYLQRHNELIKFMRSEGLLKSRSPLSFEKILSGQGMTCLHQFASQTSKRVAPEEVSEQCVSGQAKETVAIIAWYLGLFVGTVQLAFMPDGGIWMTGGVLLKNLNIVDHPEFYRGIDASPAYLSERKNFPLGVLINPKHAFLGGAYYAVKRLLPDGNVIKKPCRPKFASRNTK